MYMYSILLEGECLEQDYNFESADEAESEAGFCIETLLQCGYEDNGYKFTDFKIEVSKQ